MGDVEHSLHVVEPTKGQSGNKTMLAIIAVFVLFPIVGLGWAWFDAQGRVSRSADPFLRAELVGILGQPNKARLTELATFRFPPERQANFWKDVEADHGKLISLESLRLDKMRAGEDDRDKGQVWQFISFDAEATFEKGNATIHGVAARRTLAPDWRIDAIGVE
jgi:hypothetical protein